MPCDVWLRLILIACCGVGAATMPHRRSYFTAVQGLTAAQRRRQERDNKYRTSTPGPDYGFLPVRLRDKSDARAMIAAKELHRDREMLLGSSTHHGRDASVLAAARGLITHAERNCDMKTYQRGHAAKHGTVSSSRHAVSVSKSFASVVADSHAQCVPEGHANAASAAASVPNLPCASSVVRAGLDDAEPGDSLPVHRSEQSSTLACAVSSLVSEIRRVVQEEILSQTASLAANGLIARRVDTIEDKLAEIDRRGADSDARIATVTTGVAETARAIARIDKVAKEFVMLEGLSARVHALEAGAVSVKAIDGKIEALERQAGDVDLRLDELSARVSGSQKGQEVLGRSVQTLERSVAELGPALVPALQAGLKVQHSEFAVSVFEKQNVRFSELSNAIEDRCAGLQKDLHELATVSFKDSARLDGAEVKLEQLANTTIAQARDFARDPGDMQRQIDDLAKQLCMLSDAHGKTLDETRSRFQTEVERWHSEFESIKGDLVNMLVGDPSFYGKVPDSIKSHNFSTGSALFEAPVSVDTRACGVPASLISVGNRVVLINLSRQDLNGSIGTAVSFDYDSQRFGVKLDSGRSLSVKQENLVQHVLK